MARMTRMEETTVGADGTDGENHGWRGGKKTGDNMLGMNITDRKNVGAAIGVANHRKIRQISFVNWKVKWIGS